MAKIVVRGKGLVAFMSHGGWLSTVYEQYRRELFLAAWTVLRRTDLAEDALHTAFAKLVRLSQPPIDPKSFALRSVRNAAIDLAKMRSRRSESSLPVGWDCPVAVENISVDDESLQFLSELLNRLNARSREVIELHLHAALTFQEIGQLLDEPLATVAARYRRALEKLSKEFKIRHE